MWLKTHYYLALTIDVWFLWVIDSQFMFPFCFCSRYYALAICIFKLCLSYSVRLLLCINMTGIKLYIYIILFKLSNRYLTSNWVYVKITMTGTLPLALLQNSVTKGVSYFGYVNVHNITKVWCPTSPSWVNYE